MKIEAVHRNSQYILPIAQSVVDVMVRYQDHIDLKHKFTPRDLIREHLWQDSSLAESMKRLKIINCDEFI